MKILYLTGTGDMVGGAEVSLLQILGGLDRTYFEPFVVMPFEGEYTKRVKKLDIPVEIIPFRKVKNPFNITSSLQTVRQLIDSIRENTIDVVHANTQTGSVAFLGSLAAHFSKVPFIWHPRISFSGRIWDAIQFPLCTKVIVISEAAKKRFWWLPGKDKIVRIYNAVDVREFDACNDAQAFRNELGIQEGELLVVTIGRSHPVKKFQYLLKAAVLVAKKAPGVKFLFVGFDFSCEDKYLRFLQRLRRRLHLEDKVIFLEKRTDISRILQAADIFVFTSMVDAFGRVLIEAMAAGLPVVAFRAGAAGEIVTEAESGFLVPPKDYRAMASSITHLVKDKEMRQRYGRAGRERVEKLFSLTRHIRQIQNVYATVIRQDGYQKHEL